MLEWVTVNSFLINVHYGYVQYVFCCQIVDLFYFVYIWTFYILDLKNVTF